MIVWRSHVKCWHRVLGLALCAYFVTLNAVVHVLHTDSADHVISRSAGAEHTGDIDAWVVPADRCSPKCDDALGTCPACLYLESPLSSFPKLDTSVTPPALPEQPAVPETRPFRSDQRSPAFPRAPPTSA